MSISIQDFLEMKGMFVEYSISKGPKMAVCVYTYLYSLIHTVYEWDKFE